ncbi:DUF397 domain-containing protein [Streptomyces sp. NPDC006879]|uniref:DUF397 domain-containing protein n=1 Tax=Streptomyces sp. NPDC006879 TaxID=3364767 RepID=UPI00367793C9
MASSQSDFGAARWRKSSHSNTDGGNCVEVSDDIPGLVPVRDSKVAGGPVVVFPAPAWSSFVDAIRSDLAQP